ncbi:Cuticlin-1, partial [Armadillidium nasatum]
MFVQFFILALWVTAMPTQGYQDLDFALERPGSLPSITQLEVMCGKDHMTVQIAFSNVFQGMVFSKGQYGSPNCIYVKPFSSGTQFEFKIYYNKCGTKPDLGGRFYENTVIIQYDADLIEVWDEAKRLRCEWYNDYEKTASKPPMVIADLEVVELNFRGDNVDCWMEIQDGKGPWAAPVTGIVPLGSTLTMVIAINDKAGEFDMRVKSCEASDGVNSPIYLSDEAGCILRPKMVSKFMKLRNNDGRATVISYAHFHAFKFPDSMSVHLRCKVEICRYGCPDHCQQPVAGNPIGEGYDLYDSASENRERYERLEKTKKSSRNDFGEKTNPTVVADKKAAEEYLSLGITGKESIVLPHEEDFPWGPRNLKKRSIVLERHTRE